MEIIKSQEIYINRSGNAHEYHEAKIWSEYSLVKKLDKCFSEIEGQFFAIQNVKEYLFGLNNRENRKGVAGILTFVGSPSVGKTLMGEKIAEALKRPVLRLDMGSFNDKELGLLELFGIQKSYKSANSGQLTRFVEKNPICVVILDEFEKAHNNLKNNFLSIFDRGSAIDLFTQRDVSFRDVVFIITTNLGSDIYNKSFSNYNLSSVSQKTIINALKKEIDPQTSLPYFSGAILSRLNQGLIILFNNLRPEVIRRIITKEIFAQKKYYLEKYGITFKVNESMLADLIAFSLGENIDARTAKKIVKQFFKTNVTRLVNLTFENDKKEFCEVKIDFKFKKSSTEARRLFRGKKDLKILVCCQKEDKDKFINAIDDKAEIIFTDSKDFNILNSDVSAAIFDIDEDEELFERLIEQEIPIYVYKLKAKEIDLYDYLYKGAIDFYVDEKFPDEWIQNILNDCYFTTSLQSLLHANKIVEFNTKYIFKDESTTVIEITNFNLTIAKNAEDMDQFVSKREIPHVRLNDIYGLENAKAEINKIIEALKNYKEFNKNGIRLPRGLFLYGKPGTGKTMLAKAIASEANIQFMQYNASELMQKYRGEGGKFVRKMFSSARRYYPSLIFIDEIDIFAKSRQNASKEQDFEVLNAFLSEMDGFLDNSKTPVFVIAATNFDKIDLDPAFIRRFDKQIKIELPNFNTRRNYLSKTLKKYNKMVSEKTIRDIAMRSIEWPLGELDNVIHNSLRAASISNAERLDEILIEEFESYVNGDSKPIEENDLLVTAFHEAGHIIVAAALKEKLLYATITARGDYGGYVQFGDENKKILSRQNCLNKICIMMAGREAEKHKFGEDGITTSIRSDYLSANELARSMICEYNMEKGIYISQAKWKSSDKIDDYISKILEEQSKRAGKIIKNNETKLVIIVKKLLEKKNLDEKDLKSLLRNLRIHND